MGKTADLTVVQKTIIDTLHKEGKPQNIHCQRSWLFTECCQVKSIHLYLYSAFNNTDCVKALNSIKLEDRVSVMNNNKIKHSIFS